MTPTREPFDPAPFEALLTECRQAFLTDSSYAIAVAEAWRAHIGSKQRLAAQRAAEPQKGPQNATQGE